MRVLLLTLERLYKRSIMHTGRRLGVREALKVDA
jgi:hypothetical protein